MVESTRFGVKKTQMEILGRPPTPLCSDRMTVDKLLNLLKYLFPYWIALGIK